MPSRVWMIAVYTSAFILNSRVGLTLITRRDMGILAENGFFVFLLREKREREREEKGRER
jgi:hypothetical protein